MEPFNYILTPSIFLFRYYAKTFCGSGCIMSSAVDMTKWMNFHLNGGKNEQGDQVVNKRSIESTHVPRNNIRASGIERYFSQPLIPVSTSESSYAAGWKIGRYRGSTCKRGGILLLAKTAL